MTSPREIQYTSLQVVAALTRFPARASLVTLPTAQSAMIIPTLVTIQCPHCLVYPDLVKSFCIRTLASALLCVQSASVTEKNPGSNCWTRERRQMNH